MSERFEKSRLWNFTRSCGKTSVRLVNTDPGAASKDVPLCFPCGAIDVHVFVDIARTIVRRLITLPRTYVSTSTAITTQCHSRVLNIYDAEQRTLLGMWKIRIQKYSQCKIGVFNGPGKHLRCHHCHHWCYRGCHNDNLWYYHWRLSWDNLKPQELII